MRTPAAAEATSQPARVLIVDDEPQNRRLLEVMLASEGYAVVNAVSGEDALAKVSHQRPHIILLDVMMPGMDGHEVTRTLKADPATRNIPIVMVTALGNREARMLGLNAGAEEFLSKPVDRAELCVRVRNLLRLKALADQCDNYSTMLEGEVASRTAELVISVKSLEDQAGVLTGQAALLDLAQDAIVVRDMAGLVVFWSRGAEALYGWRAKEAVGQKASDLLRIEFSSAELDVNAILLRQGRWEGEEVHHRRDGTPVTVASRWALQRDRIGEPLRVLTLTNDITGRKQADAERLLLTERLSLATAVAKVGVWDWDLARDTVTWDTTMFEIYGLPPVVPMPYRTWSSAVYAEDRPAAEAALQLAIATKGEGAGEYRIVRPDGALRTVAAVERVILDDRGQVRRLIGVNKDVTERREAELILERSRQEQMRFKDEFLSHVSHELRSPLTAIKQFASILHAGLAGELNPEQLQYQEIVLKNIGQLQSMIDDLLEVTRLETGKLNVEQECVPLASAVRDALETLQGTAAAKGIGISADVPSELPSAWADHTRVRQVLIILLDNAVKFSGAGGEITVRARRSEEPGFLVLEVEDRGCGIDPAMAERLFERLYQVSEPAQSSRKGLGLGLHICKELVMRQGGRIWARPGPVKGSIFALTLPVFSLASVMAPLFRDDKWPAETVAVMKVEIGSPTASGASRLHEGWSEETRTLLRRCLLPDLDVLLPRTEQVAGVEEYFIAAFASEKGVAVLANRIRAQFERRPRVGKPGRAIHVSHGMLKPISHPAGQSAADAVNSMAGRLEESMRSYAPAEEVLS
jgi:PAS domain S-box-containing protein